MQRQSPWLDWMAARCGGVLYAVLLLLAAVSLLFFTRVQKLDVVRGSLNCHQIDGKSCAADVALTSEFSTSTLSTNPVITVNSTGPAVLTLTIAGPMEQQGKRGGFLLYRMAGVLRPQLLIVGRERAGDLLQRPWALWTSQSAPPGARTIFGTTPGYIRWDLTPSGIITDGQVLVLHIERTFGPATIALGPELSWRGGFADTIWSNGWIGAQVLWPLWLLLLLTPLCWRAMRTLGRAGGPDDAPERPARIVGQRLFTILLAAAFIVPLWYWLPLRALQLYLPEPFSVHGALGTWLRTLLEARWPSGTINPLIKPTDVAPLGSALDALAASVGTKVAIVLALVLAGAVAWFGAMPWRRLRLPPIGPAPMAAGLIAFAALVFLEAWRMPIGSPAVVFVGLGTVVTLLLYVVVLSLIGARTRITPADATVRTLVGRDWAIFGVLAIAYFAFRLADVGIPGTIYTDETASYGGAYVLLGGLYRWAHTLSLMPRMLAVAGCLALVGAAIAFLIWLSRKSSSWWALGAIALAAIVFVVASAAVPMTADDGMSMFRYPPLIEFVRAWFAMFNFDYLTAGRLAALAAAATAVGLVYLLGRAIGVSVLTALIGCALFTAGHIVYFYAIINGDTFFHVVGVLAAAICLVSWLVTARPSLLMWAGVATLGCYFFRQAAVELVPVVLITLAGAVLFDGRFRNRQTAWALLAYLLMVAVPVVLYQKVLVGSWFFWSNPPMTWTTFWRSLHQSARWFAEPWTLSHANGTALILAFLLALAVALWSRRTRLIAVFLLSFLVIDVLIQHLLARGTIEYQGYDRYLIPVFLAMVGLIVLAIDWLGRRFRPALGAACGIALFLIVVAQNRYAYEPVECVRPLEFSPLAQYNGQSFFFVPEKKLRAALPPDVKDNEAAFVFPGFIAGRLGFGQYSQGIGSQDALYAAARHNGQRFLAFLVPQTDACRARSYYLLEGSGADYMLAPRKSLAPARFAFIGSWPAPPLQIEVFKLQ